MVLNLQNNFISSSKNIVPDKKYEISVTSFPDQEFWKKNNETENILHLYESVLANNTCDFSVSPSKINR